MAIMYDGQLYENEDELRAALSGVNLPPEGGFPEGYDDTGAEVPPVEQAGPAPAPEPEMEAATEATTQQVVPPESPEPAPAAVEGNAISEPQVEESQVYKNTFSRKLPRIPGMLDPISMYQEGSSEGSTSPLIQALLEALGR